MDDGGTTWKKKTTTGGLKSVKSLSLLEKEALVTWRGPEKGPGISGGLSLVSHKKCRAAGSRVVGFCFAMGQNAKEKRNSKVGT